MNDKTANALALLGVTTCPECLALVPVEDLDRHLEKVHPAPELEEELGSSSAGGFVLTQTGSGRYTLSDGARTVALSREQRDRLPLELSSDEPADVLQSQENFFERLLDELPEAILDRDQNPLEVGDRVIWLADPEATGKIQRLTPHAVIFGDGIGLWTKSPREVVLR